VDHNEVLNCKIKPSIPVLIEAATLLAALSWCRVQTPCCIYLAYRWHSKAEIPIMKHF
jgi:regulator of PEP synthase PpsR (kinase-PPPase family)